MQKQIDNMEGQIKDIHEALCGNEYNDNGIIKRVKKVEKYQSKDKKQKWMVVGAAMVVGAISKYGKELLHILTP